MRPLAVVLTLAVTAVLVGIGIAALAGPHAGGPIALWLLVLAAPTSIAIARDRRALRTRVRLAGWD